MRVRLTILAALVLSSAAAAANNSRIITAHGVRLVAPAGWHRVPSAGDGPVIDPKTLLVVGTTGVHPRASQCQIAAYSVPTDGAVVVVVGWKTATSGGGHLKPGQGPLTALRAVRRPSFECFSGRGAVGQVDLAGKAYQVNVMVGDRATAKEIAEALAVARSFNVAH